MKAISFATQGVESFLEGTMRTDTQHFLSKMEGFALTGIKGMHRYILVFVSLMTWLGAAKNHQQRMSSVRADIRHEITQSLRKFSDQTSIGFLLLIYIYRGHHGRVFSTYGMEALLEKDRPTLPGDG